MAVDIRNPEIAEPAREAGSGAGIQVLAFLEALLISVWLGSMVFFSFAVAPSAFGVLPTRHLAGQIVASTLSKVEVIGLVAGGLLLVIHLIAWRYNDARPRERAARIGLVGLMILATAGMRFWISPAMNSLRAAMGRPVDDIAPSDPLRVQFNDLHQYSVTLMAIAMLAGLALLFFSVRSWIKRV
jgi:hypothetical protein